MREGDGFGRQGLLLLYGDGHCFSSREMMMTGQVRIEITPRTLSLNYLAVIPNSYGHIELSGIRLNTLECGLKSRVGKFWMRVPQTGVLIDCAMCHEFPSAHIRTWTHFKFFARVPGLQPLRGHDLRAGEPRRQNSTTNDAILQSLSSPSRILIHLPMPSTSYGRQDFGADTYMMQTSKPFRNGAGRKTGFQLRVRKKGYA
jgi:hypothetical protein